MNTESNCPTTDKEHILNKHRTEYGPASVKEIYDAMEAYAQVKLSASEEWHNEEIMRLGGVISDKEQEISDWKKDNISLVNQVSDLSITISKKDIEISQLKKQILELQDKLIGSEHPF